MIVFLKKLGWLLLDILLFLAVFGILAFLMITLLQSVIPIDYGEMSENESLQNPFVLLNQFTPLLIAAVISGILTHKYAFRRVFDDFGLRFDTFIKDYSWGWIMGLLLVAAGFLMLRLAGLLDVVGYNFDYKIIGWFLIFFIVQSLFEEITFRSYLIPAIEVRFGLWAALIISSLLFAAIHITNNNVSIPGILNIFLAGILLGILFIKYRNVWVASGFHCSWNYIQSTILGFEVSGEKTFNMIETDEVGPDLITGGTFGFEGSLIAVLFLSALIIYYLTKDQNVRRRLNIISYEETLV